MSDALTPEVPGESTAVAPVGTPAPLEEPAAAGGSASEEYVPVSRFNGLMSTLGRVQSDLERERQARTTLESQLATRQETPAMPESNPDMQALTSRVEALTEALMEERARNARTAILEQYPAAKPFADLIQGETREDIEVVARTIHERVTGILGSQTPAPAEPVVDPAQGETVVPVVEGTTPPPAGEAATPPAQQVPVVGGAVAFDGGNTMDEAINASIASGNFSEFMRLQEQRAASQLTNQVG